MKELRAELPEQKKLYHYLDTKCVWGYMTLCWECVVELKFPRHVYTEKGELLGFPYVHCEVCGKKAVNKHTGETK